jgi:hypothetical protein
MRSKLRIINKNRTKGVESNVLYWAIFESFASQNVKNKYDSWELYTYLGLVRFKGFLKEFCSFLLIRIFPVEPV